MSETNDAVARAAPPLEDPELVPESVTGYQGEQQAGQQTDNQVDDRGVTGAEEISDSHHVRGPADGLGADPAYVDDSGELPLLVPARERFAGLPALPVTHDARVDAATARLEELVTLPTAEHVEVYEDVHHRLQDALADADPH